MLPNAESAILDIRKLEDYCLNPAHPRGRHKARVFAATIGVSRQDSEWLREVLMTGVKSGDATELLAGPSGTRWRVDIPVERHRKRIVVRTIWIVRSYERVPRFITCWV